MAEVVCRDREHLLETLSSRIGETAGIGRVETFFYLRLLYRTTAGAWGAPWTMAPEPDVYADLAESAPPLAVEDR